MKLLLSKAYFTSSVIVMVCCCDGELIITIVRFLWINVLITRVLFAMTAAIVNTVIK